MPADYDGDGKADLALYRGSSSAWYVRTSSSNFASELVVGSGRAGDVPIPTDYDGNGKMDYVAYQPSTGAWYRLSQASGIQLGDLLKNYGRRL